MKTEFTMTGKYNLRERYFGDRTFYKTVFGIAVPIIIQNGITNFVSLADNIMVGQIGTEQMSGVAIVNNLMFIYFLCIFGGLSGVGIFTAQYFGYKDDEGIRHTFRYKLWLGLIIVLITTAILLIFGTPLIQSFAPTGIASVAVKWNVPATQPPYAIVVN